MRFVYRGRIAVFSVSVLRDERIVIVAEQKPGASEEDAFTVSGRDVGRTNVQFFQLNVVAIETASGCYRRDIGSRLETVLRGDCNTYILSLDGLINTTVLWQCESPKAERDSEVMC